MGSVRELYREAVARGLLDGEVLSALFRVKRGFRLPLGVIEDHPGSALVGLVGDELVASLRVFRGGGGFPPGSASS